MGLAYSKAWVTIAAHHFEASVKFYQRLFDLAPQVFVPDTYAEFELNNLRLGLYRPTALKTARPEQASSLSLCFQVEDLDVAIEGVRSIGGTVGPILTPSHGREVYVFDPEGDRIILYEPKSS